MVYLLFERRRRARVGPTGGGARWQSLLSALWEMLLAIGRSVVGLFRRRRQARASVPGGVLAARFESGPELWSPADSIRRRIAAEYRRFLTIASELVGRPRPWETAAEYGARVNQRFESQTAVMSLSDLYSEARFSGHSLMEEDAARAETWRRQVESLVAADEYRN
jgi:hypothetical protein